MTYAAFFDWNGTLFDDTQACFEATNACLGFYDIEPISLEKFRSTVHFPLLHFYRECGVDTDTFLKNGDKSATHYNYAYEEASLRTNAGLMKNAIELLEWLKQRGVLLAIISNRPEALLLEEIKAAGIADYFEVISGSVNVATMISKLSKLERLEAMMHRFNIQKGNALFIGDTEEEIHAANHAGIIGLGISQGINNNDMLSRAKPYAIIDDLMEITDILEQEWKLAA